MSANVPTPLRALLGLAAIAVEEVRKFPETLPTAMTSMPVEAISVAMQASMRLQQQLAILVSRGDEVISQFRGVGDEPPTWATFDEDPAPQNAEHDSDSASSSEWASGSASASGFDSASDADRPARAAFDLVDYEPLDNEPDRDVPATGPRKKTGPTKKTAAKKSPAQTPPVKRPPAKKSAKTATTNSTQTATTGPAVPPAAAGPAVPVQPQGPATPDSDQG